MHALNFSPSTPSTYFTASATRDPEVIHALLGRVPYGSVETIRGLNLGIVTGFDLEEKARFDMDIGADYKFRVLLPDTNSEIDVVCYGGLTPQEIELLRAHSLEGVMTRGVEQQIGFPEPVGVGLIHIIKPGIRSELVPFADREVHPNGIAESVLGAVTTRIRFLEGLHGPSPERR